jgi:hypothetical protein
MLCALCRKIQLSVRPCKRPLWNSATESGDSASEFQTFLPLDPPLSLLPSDIGKLLPYSSAHFLTSFTDMLPFFLTVIFSEGFTSNYTGIFCMFSFFVVLFATLLIVTLFSNMQLIYFGF